MAAGSKIVKGVYGALKDITSSKPDAPVDESRREFIKKAPVATVGGAGALTGLGTAAALGAKALFGQGKFDDILEKVKSAFDEDQQDISLHGSDRGDPVEILQKNLEIDDDDLAKISEETSIFEQFDWLDLDTDEMTPSEIADAMREMTDDAMGSFAYDFMKGRGDNPSSLIDEFKIPAFKLEVQKQFPDIEADELNDLARKLF